MKHTMERGGFPPFTVTFETREELAMFLGAFDNETKPQALYDKYTRKNDDSFPVVQWPTEWVTSNTWHAAAEHLKKNA